MDSHLKLLIGLNRPINPIHLCEEHRLAEGNLPSFQQRKMHPLVKFPQL